MDHQQQTTDERYMRRALQLAAYGAGHVSPNPMVGAVIVAPGGRIIGEGYHRRYGEAHAEVNAMRSVAPSDSGLISESTVYVTLEPCSHYGKTPPCAAMLCERGVRRVVIGTGDPNPRVCGRGTAMLRAAGIEVSEHCLEAECREINVRFFTAHTLRRPWILLKWAETSDGSMAGKDGSPIAISSPLTLSLMHAERAMCDAILTGTNTLLSDNPELTTRLWPGHSPRPVVFDSPRLRAANTHRHLKVFDRDPIILDPATDLESNMRLLFEDHGITSLMVEGGRTLLDSFISRQLYDRIRTERVLKFLKKHFLMYL